MSIKTLKITALFIIACTTAIAQDFSFQMAITTPKMPDGMSMKVSSSMNKVAIQPMNGPMSAMRIIIDGDAKKQYVLMENKGQKTAMVVDPFDASKTSQPAVKPTVRHTKEIKTIGGLKCTKAIVESNGNTTEMWLAKESGINYQQFFKIFNSTKGTPGTSAILPDAADIKGFPMEITTKEKSGDVTTMRMSNISKSKIDPTVFSRTGYKEVDMTKKSR
jgi:hypothetical protein